jgi:hypothetical protein
MSSDLLHCRETALSSSRLDVCFDCARRPSCDIAAFSSVGAIKASASIVSDARPPAPPLDIVASPHASSATDVCPHTIYAPCDYMRIHGYSLADRL